MSSQLLKSSLRILAILSVCILLSSCKTVSVQDGISQKQANQIVAVLHNYGIAAVASKERGGRGNYSVTVNTRQYSEAVSILAEEGLPGEPHISFRELVAQRGLLPNSREIESLRLDHAIAVQIEDALRNFPQISAAKVVVRSHSIGPEQDPSVSVVIQTVPGTKIEGPELVKVVSNAVPEVDIEKISISLEESLKAASIRVQEGVANVNGNVVRVPLVPFLIGWRVPKDDYVDLALALVVFLVAMAFLGVVCGYWYATYKYSREFSIREIPERIPRQLQIDDVNQEDLPEA